VGRLKLKENKVQFSLVSTVFNEIERLDEWITGIESQSVLPDEIIITDAGSTDGTLGALEDWKERSDIAIKLLVEKGCNVAKGRNLAIAEAQFDWILSTDFGCAYHPDWIKSLVEHFENEAIDVVAGAFGASTFEKESAAARADLVLQNGYPVVQDQYFTASSRSIAYRRSVWEKLGGYEEWLTLAADDTIFWRRIKKVNIPYLFVEEPYVFWGRHKSYRQFGKESYRYGLGDGESGINRKNFWSTIVESAARYTFIFVLALHIITLIMQIDILWSFIFLVPSSIGLRSYLNAWRNYHDLKPHYALNLRDLMNALFLVEVSRYNYISGYLKGWIFTSAEVRLNRAKLQSYR